MWADPQANGRRVSGRRGRREVGTGNVSEVAAEPHLGEAEDLAAEVEGVAEARLLALLGGESLDGLEVEVVVEVQVVDVLAVDEQVEHIVALPADLLG